MSKAKKNLRGTASKVVAQGGESKIRIIGGDWRGRKLPVLSADGLRPTGDRLRETLFNWLMPHIHGANCLDAFSGTGALAFEALSRGAAKATLIEKSSKNAQQLKENTKLLQANANVFAQDFLTWEAKEKYDLVFLDPPFAEHLWQKAIDHLCAQDALNENALVYIEQPLDVAITLPTHWLPLKSKKAGQVHVALFEAQAKGPKEDKPNEAG